MALTPHTEALALWAGLVTEAGRLGPRTRFLDVGGGSGLLTRAVCEVSGADGVLADPHAEPVPGLMAVRCRGECLPFASGAFDAVLISHVLHHVLAPSRAVMETARVLAPGGTLLIRTASHENLRALAHARWIDSLLSGILTGIPDTSEIRTWLVAAGLTNVALHGVSTPQDAPLAVYAESVALQAFRNWALSPDAGPDPRAAARAWALESFTQTPPVLETLIIARQPFAPVL